MKVRYTPRALDDLAEISKYLIERNAPAADAVGTSVRTVVSLLREFPASGRVLERRPTVRVIPLVRYPYLIFYTVTEDEIAVLHVRHGARRPVEPNEL